MRSNLAHSSPDPHEDPPARREQVQGFTLLAGSDDVVADPLSERWMGKTIRVHVAEFGHVFGLLGMLIAAWLAWKSYALSSVAIAAIAGVMFRHLCLSRPRLMRPLWSGWMKGAMMLGAIMTAVLLSIMWTLVLLPLAVLLKIIGKRVMDLSFRDGRASYWEPRAAGKDDFVLLERQF